MPSFRSGSTASHSYHGNSVAASLLHLWSLKQSVSLPIRSVHIKPSPVETDPTDVLLGIPQGKPRNLVNRNQATRRHAPQIASEAISRAASDSSLQIVFLVHAPPWRPPRPPIFRTWEPGPHPTLHAPSRASRISGCSFTRWWLSTRRTQLLMSSDVIGWRHQSTSARATSARVHVIDTS